MIADYFTLCDNDRHTMEDLVRSLGVEPTNVSSRFAVEYINGRCCLLLDEYQRHPEHGTFYVVDDEIVTAPFVFEVDRAALPGPLRPSL